MQPCVQDYRFTVWRHHLTIKLLKRSESMAELLWENSLSIDSIYSVPGIGNCNYFTRYVDPEYPACYTVVVS